MKLAVFEKVCLLGMLVMITGSFPAGAYDLTRQPGLSPLQLPAGNANMEFPFSYQADFNAPAGFENETMFKISIPRFSYALNNWFMFYSLPWPIVQFKILGPNRKGNNTSVMDNFHLSLRAGLTGSIFNANINPEQIKGWKDKIHVFPELAILAKLIINNKYAIDADCNIKTISRTAVLTAWNFETGWQVHDRFYFSAGYRGGIFHFSETPYFGKKSYLYLYADDIGFYHSSSRDGFDTYVSHRAPISIDATITSKSSLSLSTSLGKHTPEYLPVSLKWAYTW